MKVYIKGNYIKDGVGYHGQVVDVSEWKANELISDNQAITEEAYLKQQEADERIAAERAAFDAERAAIDGESESKPSKKATAKAPAPEAPTHV